MIGHGLMMPQPRRRFHDQRVRFGADRDIGGVMTYRHGLQTVSSVNNFPRHTILRHEQDRGTHRERYQWMKVST